jgi:hypothetical protein
MPEEDLFTHDDPRYHVANLRKLLSAGIDYARKDIKQISDPKAQALFETTTEMLVGIRRAFEAFEHRDAAAGG